MTSLVSASQVVTGQVQSLDSVRAHALPSDAMIFASATKVQPANQNPGSYAIVESGVNSLGVTATGSVPAVTQSPFADLYKEGSIYFNGSTGNYLQNTASYSNSTIQWNTTGMTIEAWVNYPTFVGAHSAAPTPIPTLFGLMSATTTTNQWSFGANTAGYVNFYYFNGTYQTVMSTTQLSANTWNHIAMTCSTSGQIFLFVNGVQTTVVANRNGSLITPATNFETVQGTPSTNQSPNIAIGQYSGSTAVNAYVADVRLTTGTPVYTGSTGSLATFTVPSAPLISTTSPGVTQFLLRAGANSPYIANGALTFDRGLKQYMNFGPQTFNIATRGFTALFKYTWNGTVSNFERIFQASQSTANQNNSILIARNQATGVLIFQYVLGGSFSSNPSTSALSQGVNYVVALVYNPSVGSGTAQFWVNGVPSGSPVTGLASAITTDLLTPFSFVGCDYTGAGSLLNASMNTLAVYNRALSNVEILNAYSALTTNTVNAPIEIGDANGTPAMSIAGDGRVSVTQLGQTSNVVPWPPAAMTGYVTSLNGQNYVASASSEYDTNNRAWYAFDKNSSTSWATTGSYSASNPYSYTGTVTTTDVNGTVYPGDWLQIQFPVQIVLSSYSFQNFADASKGLAKWVVLGSRDGVNWTLVDSRSGQAYSASTLTFSTSSQTNAFIFYRLVINQCTGNSTIIALYEWTLYGTADTAQTLTVAQPVTLSYGAQTASLTGISGDKYVPQDFSSSGLNVPAYVVSNTATVANTVQYSSFGPFAGEGSLYFAYPVTTTLNQCGAYVNFGPSTPPNFTPVGTPMTIEGWVYVMGTSSDGNYYTFLEHGSPNTGAGSAYDMASFVTNGYFYFGLTGLSPTSAACPGIVYNAWNHVSGCWNGTNIVYSSVNGTVVSQAVTGTPTFNSAYSFLAGAQGGAYNMRGYVACVRVTRGAALYTTTFVPPTAPLQPIQGTTQAGLPYGTVLLLRNAPAPGRVLTSKFGGANSGQVLAFPPAAMTTYATTLNSGYGQGTYVASASSDSSGYPAWGAFNKNASTSWSSNQADYTTYNSGAGTCTYAGTVTTVDANGTSYAGQWVQIQTPSSIVLSNYQVQSRSDAGNGGGEPKTWWVLGSRDGTSWNLADQRSGISWNGAASNNFITVQSSQAFTYFRMVVNVVGASFSGQTNAVLGEWTLNGTIEGPSVSADGRLGLGVSNPVQALEVAGNMIVNGTVSAGNPLMFRNAVYNGDMRIAQRGTSFSSTGAYTLDRWYIASSTGALTVSQIQSGLANFSNAVQIQTTSTTSQNIYLSQSLETRDVVRFQGQTVTVSLWYRTPTSSTGGWATWVWSSTANDTKLTDIGSGTGLGNGGMPNTTAWTYAQFSVFVPNTVNSMSVMFLTFNNVVNGAQIQITGVQLEKGTVATPFEVRPYATELALCQRYYQRFQPSISGGQRYLTTGCIMGATTAGATITLPVGLRSNLVTMYNNTGGSAAFGSALTIGSSEIYFYNGGTNFIPTTVTLSSVSTSSAEASSSLIYLNFGGGSGGSAGVASMLLVSGAGAFFAFGAEL